MINDDVGRIINTMLNKKKDKKKDEEIKKNFHFKDITIKNLNVKVKYDDYFNKNNYTKIERLYSSNFSLPNDLYLDINNQIIVFMLIYGFKNNTPISNFYTTSEIYNIIIELINKNDINITYFIDKNSKTAFMINNPNDFNLYINTELLFMHSLIQHVKYLIKKYNHYFDIDDPINIFNYFIKKNAIYYHLRNEKENYINFNIIKDLIKNEYLKKDENFSKNEIKSEFIDYLLNKFCRPKYLSTF